MVARRAHNPKVTGSSPVPATTQKPSHFERAFLFALLIHCIKRSVILSNAKNPRKACAEARALISRPHPIVRNRLCEPFPATSPRRGEETDRNNLLMFSKRGGPGASACACGNLILRSHHPVTLSACHPSSVRGRN